MKIIIRNRYSGRQLTLLCDAKKYYNSEGRWDWLTDYQRKRIENYFGKMQAYYCERLPQE